MKAKYLIKGLVRSIPGFNYVRNIRDKTGVRAMHAIAILCG